MPLEIHELQMTVREHDIKLSRIEKLTEDGLAEQRQLINGLHTLTSKLDVYIERHDQVNESSKRLWTAYEQHSRDIATLQNISASNQPIIDGLRSLNAKLVWAITGFFFSPAVIAGIYIYSKGG